MMFSRSFVFLFGFLVLLASVPFLGAESSHYLVLDSDNKSSIVQSAKVPWDVLLRVNPDISTRKNYQGLRVYIPQSYKIREGDTLYSLGRRWKVSPERIQDVNDIKNPHLLFVSKVIYIPQSDRSISNPWPVNGQPSAPHGMLKIVEFQKQSGAFRSTCDGTVLFNGSYQGLGKVILVENDVKRVFGFGNFEKSDVQYGQKVKIGEVLGQLSPSEELHFFVSSHGKPVNPFDAVGR